MLGEEKNGGGFSSLNKKQTQQNLNPFVVDLIVLMLQVKNLKRRIKQN